MPLSSYIFDFIHPSLRDQQHNYFKAKALIWLYLFALLTAIVLKILAIVFNHTQTTLVPYIIFIPFSLWIFKKSGNLLWGGNLLSFILAVTLVPSVIDTGGLLSDNLLWCVFIPLIALLFGNFYSGLFWMVGLIGFCTWLLLHQQYNLEHILLLQNPPDYYFTSYVALFIGLFSVLNIFRYEQYKLIIALSEKNEMLELQKSEISRKTSDLETAKALLENSNRELEQFAYIASHDLKEPLRMISMYVQMIQKRLKGVLEGDTEEFMGFVTDGVKRMQQMLEDLLKYSRLGKNQDYNLVDLNDTLFLVQQNLKVYIKEKKAKVEVDTLPQIYGISSEINQLFQNLISNGIKFHDDARIPVVKIGMLESTEKFFTIFVKDNGIGIPADSKLRIFNLFERLHNRSDYQGTGKGLATCRKVVENLGGEIWADSVEGEGSTFFIKLPNTVLDPPPGGID